MPARRVFGGEGPRNATPLTCVQDAGDLLVLPDLWGHATLNLEPSVGLAREFTFVLRAPGTTPEGETGPEYVVR